MNSRVGVVVVVYNPDIDEFVRNLDSYRCQCDMVVVVDNSEVDSARFDIRRCIEHMQNAELIQLTANVGIARAQNIGINALTNKGMDYFIEMDQDSFLPEHYVSAMLESHLFLQRQGIRLCGIGPVAKDRNTGKPHGRNCGPRRFVEVSKTLSSGFFSSIDAFLCIGEKDESLFIDLVDWEWNFRARALGFSTYIDTHSEMQHVLGEGHKTFLFLTMGVPQPLRHYYQFRNTVLLMGRGYVPLKWKAANVCKLIFKLLVYPLVLSNGRKRLRYMLLGLRDGLKGRSGVMNGP
jgi:rhamnosyltransferase